MCRNQGKSAATVRERIAKKLEAHGIENALREAEWLLMHVTGRSRLDLIIRPDQGVSPAEEIHLGTLLERRCAREPLQYIIGSADFYGRTFFVNSSVLIPRPETEELVEAVLELPVSDLAGGVIDLGTGSGCIPVSVALERKGVPCTGVDLSANALDVARANAAHLGAHVTWVEADMADPSLPRLIGEAASVLVSNPPYIPEAEKASMQAEVLQYEPHMALFAGSDSLHFYNVIADQAGRLLRAGGHVLVEIHADAGEAVCHLFNEAGLRQVVLQRDMAGRDRIVRARVP
jgi:release factor glutamine methyltransferase